MNLLSARGTAGVIVVMLIIMNWRSAAQTPPKPGTPPSLCTSYVGPAFIIPDEAHATIAVHAGPSPGISLVSLNTRRAEGFIPVLQPILAASLPRADGALTLALSDGKGVRISNFDIAGRKETSTRLFRALDAQMAVFSPNGKYLLGVTTTGAVFKMDLVGDKVELIEGLALRAASIAVSPTSTRLYVAGDGLTVIDVDRMTVASSLTSGKRLLEVASSPDGLALALRNLHDIEVVDLTESKNNGVLASVAVDPTPNGASVSSISRLAFTMDGSTLFYIRASDTESELVSLSINPLHIETRSQVGPYPNAIATAPDRRWVLISAGFTGHEQLEAIDMKTQAVVFKADLPGSAPAPTKGSHGCPSATN